MDLTALPYRCFLAIIDRGTFGSAARMLHISQPALSAKIKELERQLGFPLFTRTSRKVMLTSEGVIFADYARRLVMETDWVNLAAREIRSNPLRIGTPHFSGMITERGDLLDRFIVEHEDIPLSITTRTQVQLIDDFRQHALDFALMLIPKIDNASSHSGVEDVRHLNQMMLATRKVSLAIPAEHPLATHLEISAKDIVGQPIYAPSRAHGILLSEIIARDLSNMGISRLRAPEGDALSVLRFAALTRSIAIDLGWFTPPLSPAILGKMVSRSMEGLDISIDLVLLWDDRPMRAVAEHFWLWAQKLFSSSE